MGYHFILGEMFLERGANLESRAVHTHPKNTRLPPPPPPGVKALSNNFSTELPLTLSKS